MFRKIFLALLILLLTTSILSLINIKPVKADIWRTTIHIKADGNIEPTNVSIQRNNNIYTLTSNIPNSSIPPFSGAIGIEKDNIILDGAGYTIKFGDPDIVSFYGLILEGRHNVTLKNLRISGAVSCVQISNCSQITLINNSLSDGFHGCQLSASVNCSIIGNKLGGLDGLEVENSSNTLIVENNINRLWPVGIELNNKNINNSIYHNNFGIIYNSSTNYSNVNNFWDNGYPSGGNYWRFINDEWPLGAPYYPVDVYHGLYQNITGSDGIGDLPFSVNSISFDRYPLMAPYTTFNVSIKANTQPFFVGIISNSSLNNFIVNEVIKTVSFNVNGSTNTGGFSRIILPKGLVESFWNKGYTVLLDNVIVPFSNNSDDDFTYIYLNYSHSQHNIMIIESSTVPEFSSLTLMIILVTIINIVFFVEKKHVRKN